MKIILLILLLPCVASATDVSSHNLGFKSGLPDTGQTLCYDNTTEIACPTVGQDFYGQDAQYNSEVSSPSYTIYNPVGISSVTVDNNTGLMWIYNPATDAGFGTRPQSWLSALSSCTVTMNAFNSGAGYAGFTDWRLPNLKEAMSIGSWVSASQSVNKTYFPFTAGVNDYIWTSTTFLTTLSTAMSYRQNSGLPVQLDKTSVARTQARCVRGGPQ